jgi:hypothetical protein
MKIFLLSALVILSLNNLAQTLTQANHAPSVGDTYSTLQCDSSNVSINGSGANYNWILQL